MKSIQCKVKSYPIKHHSDDTKHYSKSLYAVASGRPDGGHDVVIHLGYYNEKTHKFKMNNPFKETYLDIITDDNKVKEVENLLRKYAGLPHTRTVPVISFLYTNDLTLYEAIGSFKYPKSDEYKIQSITHLSKDKSEFAKYISEHYTLEPKTEPIILEVN